MEFYVIFKYEGGHSIHGPFNDPDVAFAFSVDPVFKNHYVVQSEIVNSVKPEEVKSINSVKEWVDKYLGNDTVEAVESSDQNP